jgi:hypothetical protein
MHRLRSCPGAAYPHCRTKTRKSRSPEFGLIPEICASLDGKLRALRFACAQAYPTRPVRQPFIIAATS